MAQLHPDATAANRLGFDYSLEANRLGAPKVGIIDVHTHLRDPDAVAVFAQAAEQFGVQEVWSMSPLEQLNDIRSVLGDKVQFIAQPNFRSDDLLDAMGEGYLRRIQEFHQAGARLVKFWAAPRAIDLAGADRRAPPRLVSQDFDTFLDFRCVFRKSSFQKLTPEYYLYTIKSYK